MKVLIADNIDTSTFDLFKEHGIEFDYKPEILPNELQETIGIYDGLLVRSRTKVTREVIYATSNLKVIGRVGAGIDNIDLQAARIKYIKVVNAPDANSHAVAELTVGLIISLLRHIPRADATVKNNMWLKGELNGSEIGGKVVGIVGYGQIGKIVERMLSAFGASILIHSRSYKTATFKEIFEKCDIVSLHLALTNETRGCVTDDLLALMKPTAFLINTSRGQIINEEALYTVLSQKKIKGAALDVFWQEPLPPDSKWRRLDNIILTPHIGAATSEALHKASLTTVEDVIKILNGGKGKYEVLM